MRMQVEGVDYTEIFSPLVRYDSLRTLLSIVTNQDLELVQFDVKTAFLYGDIDKDIFMKIPQGIEVGDSDNNICKLQKSLYGLKQSPRCWNNKFKDFLKIFNLEQSSADQCIFHGTIKGADVYLALFVDDGLIASKSREILDDIISKMREYFDISLGDASYFVGIQIERNRDKGTMIIHQQAYINKMIKMFGMSDAKPLSVPADPNVTLRAVYENNDVPYREAVGSLMFVATVSRPDIAFAVHNVSRYINKHNDFHWQAVKRIMKYFIGTANYGIKYEKSDNELIGFCDSDYANDIDTRKSVGGFVFCLSNGAITWSSQKQNIVALSTTEAEYVAAASATKEIVWIRKLLTDIGCECNGGTVLYIDNQSAIRLAKNPEFHKRTKHIDIRYHYIREKVQEKEIFVEYVQTVNQRADIFTKALPNDRFKYLCSLIGISDLNDI